MARAGRRRLLGAAGASLLAWPAAALPVPASGALSFRVQRNGSPLGTHSVQFAAAGEALTVNIAIDYLVKVGPIVVFRYSSRATEQWRGSVLTSVRSKTNDDGTAAYMNADREGDALLVDGSKSGRYRAPKGSIASSHWNRAGVAAPLIDLQNGELLRFAAAQDGNDTVRTAAGTSIPATRIGLTGPSKIDLWYDRSNVWAGLLAIIGDGSRILYERN